MILAPTGVRVWLATGHTDMRKGFASLSLHWHAAMAGMCASSRVSPVSSF
jgi:hypothetical protein